MLTAVHGNSRHALSELPRRLVACFLALLLIGGELPVWGCYAVIVGRKASADGSVLVGHNEQNGGRRILNFRRIPRQRYEEKATVALRRGGSLPQVKQTYAFLWSENPGIEFSDSYINEWGVAIVSDGCPTREDSYQELASRGEIRDGGIGYMLRRLVAQRAKTVREGIRIAGGLIERFGYVDSGRTYVVADPNEAWLLSVVRGPRWVAQRVPDDAVAIVPNVHIIGEVNLDDTDNFLASADLVSYAIKRGWFDPNGGKPFNFRKAYCHERDVLPDPRRYRGQQLVTGNSTSSPPGGPLPFAVRPVRKMTVADVIGLLRDRETSPLISAPATQEAAVFQLRAGMPREVGCIYWRTTAEPSTSVLTPWYLGTTRTPKSYYLPVDIQTQLSLDHHFSPPQGTFDRRPKLAWWQFLSLQEAVHEDYDDRIQMVRPTWDSIERAVFRKQLAVENHALLLLAGDQGAARDFLTRYCTDLALKACRDAERLTRKLRSVPPQLQ